jgi:ABC-type arginine transport system permease subunit
MTKASSSFWATLLLLSKAAGVTVLLAVASTPLTVLVGLGLASARGADPSWLRRAAASLP